MKEDMVAKVKIIEEKYLNKEVSFSGDDENAKLIGEVISVTVQGELRIKDKKEGFVYLGAPEDVDLVSEKAEEDTLTTIEGEETEISDAEEKEEISDTEEKLQEKDIEPSEIEIDTQEKKEQDEPEKEKSVKKVKDQILAEIIIRDGGGTIKDLTDALQKEAGGSLIENEYKVKNFMRFLTFLDVVELEDDLYIFRDINVSYSANDDDPKQNG